MYTHNASGKVCNNLRTVELLNIHLERKKFKSLHNIQVDQSWMVKMKNRNNLENLEYINLSGFKKLCISLMFLYVKFKKSISKWQNKNI